MPTKASSVVSNVSWVCFQTSVAGLAGVPPAMTLFLSITERCVEKLVRKQIPSIYRKESSACGDAARAMHSVRPFFNAALRAEGPSGFPLIRRPKARRYHLNSWHR